MNESTDMKYIGVTLSEHSAFSDIARILLGNETSQEQMHMKWRRKERKEESKKESKKDRKEERAGNKSLQLQ